MADYAAYEVTTVGDIGHASYEMDFNQLDGCVETLTVGGESMEVIRTIPMLPRREP